MNQKPLEQHYVFFRVDDYPDYNIRRVNNFNRAMRIAESVCKKTVKEKAEAFREWVKAIREALK